METAKGEYAAILDDDDEWICKDKLSRQKNFLDNHPEHVLVGTKVVVVTYEGDKEIIRPNLPGNDGELRERMLTANPFAHSSLLYRREVALSLGGYDLSLPRGKDLDLILKLGKTGKVAVLPERRKNKDAKATLKVVWRHKKDYPRAFRAIAVLVFRVFVFSSLKIIILPRLWRV